MRLRIPRPGRPTINRSTSPAQASSAGSHGQWLQQHVLHLQRTIGNKATQQMLNSKQSPLIQAKRDHSNDTDDGDGRDDDLGQQMFSNAEDLMEDGKYQEAANMYFNACNNLDLSTERAAKAIYNAGVAYFKWANAKDIDFDMRTIYLKRAMHQFVQAKDKYPGLSPKADNGIRKVMDRLIETEQLPKDTQKRFEMACDLANAGGRMDAIQMFVEIYDAMSGDLNTEFNAKLQYNLGACYFNMGMFTDALRHGQALALITAAQPHVARAGKILLRKVEAKLRKRNHAGRPKRKQPIIF